MLHSTPHLWVISLLCSIGAATTGSAIYSNTTCLTSLHRTVGSTVSPSALNTTAISSIRSSAISRIRSTSTTSIASLSYASGNGTGSTSKNRSTADSSSTLSGSGLTTSTGSGVTSVSSAASSAISALDATPQPSIWTSTVVGSGSTQLVAVLQGGSIATPITFAVPTTTITPNSPDLSTSVASVSSQIAALYPALSSWASDPAPAKATPIINDITVVVGGIAALLGSLPQGGGLFGSLISDLGSIVNGLEEIKGNLPNSNAVESVQEALDGVQSDTESLETDEDGHDDDSSSASETKSFESTTSTSSSSSCTSTTTGYNTYVTCTAITSTAPSTSSVSISCETSTITTTGCDVTTTASTTTVGDCPLGAQTSISAAYLSLGDIPHYFGFWKFGLQHLNI
ncbi:MAG: hypothetical protein M1813_009272 [Trichoglossum hirsutum]|nr:MAG: hypothetical protein M1813_009272 [Trichoglossum hirsutum]